MLWFVSVSLLSLGTAVPLSRNQANQVGFATNVMTKPGGVQD